MKDTTKKYKQAASTPMPNIGVLLQQYFKSSNKMATQAQLAKDLHINSSGIKDYLKRESVQIGILWKISLATQHNFIAQLAEALPVPYQNAKETELNYQIQQLKDTNTDLQKELEIYKRIVGK